MFVSGSVDLSALADAAKNVREKASEICKKQAEAHAQEMKRLLAAESAGNESESAQETAPDLADSVEVVRIDGGYATVVKGPALFLEFGTSKSEARPFVEAALDKVKE